MKVLMNLNSQNIKDNCYGLTNVLMNFFYLYLIKFGIEALQNGHFNNEFMHN